MLKPFWRMMRTTRQMCRFVVFRGSQVSIHSDAAEMLIVGEGIMADTTQTRAVLVTGCSSGIGRATAEYLAGNGFLVFATVRKAADAESLRGLKQPNLVPVCPVDLSKVEDIAAAVEIITAELQKRGIDGLFAIVNNAGAG